VRRDTRRLAYNRHVEMGDDAGACAHTLAGESEKALGRRAAPLRIARRKVHADVAVSERAEDGIDQRMQRNVGIGMSGEPARMRDAHAAKHDVIAVAEGVHVEAISGAHVGERRNAHDFSSGKIVVGREFHVGGLACKHVDAVAGPFGKRGVVGKILEPRRSGTPVGFDDEAEGEGLRRLHHAQPAAIERLRDHVPLVDLLDGVGNGDGRDRGAVRLAGDDGARDQVAGEERSRGIVDEDDIGCAAVEGLKARPHRRLAGRPAVDGRQCTQAGRGGVKQLFVIVMNDRLHCSNLWVRQEGGEGRADDRLAGQVTVLLGQISAGAVAAARGDNDCSNPPGHDGPAPLPISPPL
jgi:hypothetical protein